MGLYLHPATTSLPDLKKPLSCVRVCFLICKIKGCTSESLPALTFCVHPQQKCHNSYQYQPKCGMGEGNMSKSKWCVSYRESHLLPSTTHTPSLSSYRYV